MLIRSCYTNLNFNVSSVEESLKWVFLRFSVCFLMFITSVSNDDIGFYDYLVIDFVNCGLSILIIFLQGVVYFKLLLFLTYRINP